MTPFHWNLFELLSSLWNVVFLAVLVQSMPKMKSMTAFYSLYTRTLQGSNLWVILWVQCILKIRQIWFIHIFLYLCNESLSFGCSNQVFNHWLILEIPCIFYRWNSSQFFVSGSALFVARISFLMRYFRDLSVFLGGSNQLVLRWWCSIAFAHGLGAQWCSIFLAWFLDFFKIRW